MKIIFKIHQIHCSIRKAVGWGVALLLFWMVLLALAQLLLRWILSSGLPWADQHLRQLVLWIALLGGILAASDRRHIRIDLINQYLNSQVRRSINRLVTVFAGCGSAFLCYLSFDFIQIERTAGARLTGILLGMDVAQWVLFLIIPLGFALMSFFFFSAAFIDDEQLS